MLWVVGDGNLLWYSDRQQHSLAVYFQLNVWGTPVRLCCPSQISTTTLLSTPPSAAATQRYDVIAIYRSTYVENLLYSCLNVLFFSKAVRVCLNAGAALDVQQVKLIYQINNVTDWYSQDLFNDVEICILSELWIYRKINLRLFTSPVPRVGSASSRWCVNYSPRSSWLPARKPTF